MSYIFKAFSAICFIFIIILFNPFSAKAEVPIVKELRLGIYDHDSDFIGSSHEQGVALNVELVLRPAYSFEEDRFPSYIRSIFEPQFTIGAMVATDVPGTDHVYGGLTWSFDITDRIFLDFFFGLAYHNGNSHADLKKLELKGKIHNITQYPKMLGCPVLFKESIDVGYRLGKEKKHKIALSVSHLSHGQMICDDDRNGGMDHLGIRYTYVF